MILYDKNGGYSGFLGNIMFQLASTVGIAKKNGHDYAFPYKKEFDFFKEHIPVLHEFYNLNLSSTIDIPEKGFEYEDIILNSETLWSDYNLLGYRQSYKYFQHCEDRIRDMFEFNDDIKKYIQDKYINNIPLDNTLISIHVRRGDYLNHPDHHPTMPIEYYNKAISLINDVTFGKRKYIVFSNDFTWCKVNFANHPQIDNFIFAEGNQPEQDMFFMTLCHHHVIANSTMSWWGSYLCRYTQKVIVAPLKSKWFGKAYSDWNLDDLYLPNWLTI